MLMPLKEKYLVPKPRGNKSRTKNNKPKKKSIAALLYASAISGQHRRSST